MQQIGTVDGGGRGKLSFTTAPGRGTRRIEAQFELDGLPAEKLTVARFGPPSSRLARPAKLRVRRRRITLKGISRSSAGRVSVRGVSDLIQGRAASARFRAIGPRESRFGPLPKAPRLR